MIAHNVFYADRDGDGVYFFIVKARGEFRVPNTLWGLARFEDEFANLEQLTVRLEELTSMIQERRPNALATYPAKPSPRTDETSLS